MDGFLQVNDNSSRNLALSPTNSFIADEVASICPLITPSPPTNDLINPLPEPEEATFIIGDELATRLQKVHDDSGTGADSASSSSSALAEPACVQLLSHRNVYHHISKNDITIIEETVGKTQPLQLTFRNPPDNYFFMSWNWPLIRKISLWTFLSGLLAMLALVIAMITNLPKTCNPYTEWYQGSVMYEVFPASFYDSNNDMIGDFKGLSQNADYFTNLGVAAVRLNSIFRTQHYPEDYRDVKNLIDIAPLLGDIDDFKIMAKHLHSRNISLILDLPVYPVIKELGPIKVSGGESVNGNQNITEPSIEFLRVSQQDPIEEALVYWISNGVDGFYLKNLDHFLLDPHFGTNLRHWKKFLGPNRPLIVNQSIIEHCPKEILQIVLNNVDLVDIRLEIAKGEQFVSKQLENIQNGTLFSRPGTPWIQWSLGDESTTRLANLLPYGNGTLGATLLQLMLPGTPSIFYGNEIGLQQIRDPEGDRQDLNHLHQLAAMAWPNKYHRGNKVLSWMHGERTETNFEQIGIIAKMIDLRAESPAIYINSVYKEGDNRANAEVKYSRSDLLVIQRWYPRRRSFVVVSNMGSNRITADLSTLLYSGDVVIGPRTDSKPGSISFKEIALWPGESVVISLD